jgi:hypothetical protein
MSQDAANALSTVDPTADRPDEIERDRRPTNGYWSTGKTRWFVSTKSDLGMPYLKPYFSFGYGLPHWLWAGIDINTITTLEFTQGYAGARASSPVLTLSFGKPFLAPAASYRHDDVVTGRARGAHYAAWEAEAVASVPLPYFALVFDLIAVRILDAPDNKYLYEESYRAVVSRPLFAVLRVAAVARLLREDALKVGVLSEAVFSTGRATGVLRIGPACGLTLTDHLEALGALSVVVASPDTLGFALGAYGLAGLRYRWATGEPDPKLPWSGTLIP